jgi:glycosyltransferase involved in cell wall biosynthesis
MNTSLKRHDELRFAPVDVPNVGTSERPLRVLVLDEEIPYPPNAGKRIRTWNLLQRLARRHAVSLLCYGNHNDSAAAIQEAGIKLYLIEPQVAIEGWRLYISLFANLFSRYPFSVAKHYSLRFQAKLEELLEHDSWDLIQCEWTPYARFVTPTCPVPVLVATHNIESQIWARRAQHTRNPIAKAFFRTQEWKMRRFEKHALLHASAVTAVTTPDVDTAQQWGVRAVSLIPNGVDLEAYSPAAGAEHENEILILASLDWHPNIDALNHFIEDIFPLVRTRQSKARLRIVGRKPSETLRKRFSGIADIDFVGEVEDVRCHLDHAAVVAVPLRIGGGSRIKILEALAAGKAVVSTSIGAEGLDVVSGQHLIVADSPSEFAESVVKLLASTDARHRLGAQGRALVNERYGWDGIAKQLESAWHDVSKSSVRRETTSSAPPRVRVAP